MKPKHTPGFAKTRRGKMFLQDRAPKVIENDKNTLIVKGGKTSELVSKALIELYQLKKPLAQNMKRNNPFHPFEDESGLIKFSQKHDSSLFLFGSNSKKHPNALIFGRMFDYALLDMVELSIKNFKASIEFQTNGTTFGTKPCIILQGPLFDSDPTMKRIGNLMVDFFKGPKIENVRLQGLELIVTLTAISESEILFRVYQTQLKKSETNKPRVELVERGPCIDFKVDRKKLASDDLYKTATRKPKELMVRPKKNISRDVFGSKMVRIHVGKQNPGSIQTRKIKALRGNEPKSKKIRFEE